MAVYNRWWRCDPPQGFTHWWGTERNSASEERGLGASAVEEKTGPDGAVKTVGPPTGVSSRPAAARSLSIYLPATRKCVSA
jgi:hypothetical protein